MTAPNLTDIEEEFAEKIPRTLLRLTEEGRKAFQQYQSDMKQVLGSLSQ